MPRTDVAIYTPSAAELYEAAPTQPVGGAERQVALLASALAGAGLRVAHIVFRLRQLRPPEDDRIRVVERLPPGGGPIARRVKDGVNVWRSLVEADADTYIVRMATPALGTVGVFCRMRRRTLVFSGANDTDFTFESVVVRERFNRLAYRLGVSLSQLVVVQTTQQRELARRAFPRARVVEIPSFAEGAPATQQAPESFVWIGRLVPEKDPLAYVELARAVPEAQFLMVAWETNQTPLVLAADLRRRVQELPNLELVGGQPRERLLELIDRSAAVVVTGTAEGMPNVSLEGWARGIPTLTLAFDPDGRIGAHGLGVAAGGSWEVFTEGARRLWDGRQDRDELARRTRAYIAQTHSEEAVGERWRAALAGLRSG